MRQNHLTSRGIHPTDHTVGNKNSLSSQGDSRGNDIHVQNQASVGAADANREWELNDNNIDMSVDDEEAQRNKWRR